MIERDVILDSIQHSLRLGLGFTVRYSVVGLGLTVPRYASRTQWSHQREYANRSTPPGRYMALISVKMALISVEMVLISVEMA